jgi:4-amino-4-deoxy-L-arabinose transferase-like glycosyltransferase
MKTPFNYDEGFAVFNATRVMDGDVPYRDFWAIYPPGQFYALAAIFRIFGATLFVVRIYDTIVRFVIVISVYLIAKKTTTPPLALFVCIVTTLLLASARSYALAVFPSLALGLLSILSLLEHVNTGQRRWLLLTGMLIGIATLFRWDIVLLTVATKSLLV